MMARSTEALSLADRAALQDVNARFGWALDLKDYDALHELFAPDVHYTSPGREFFDRETLVQSFEQRQGERTTRHGLGNLLLCATGEGTAIGRGSWHTFASNHEPAQGIDLYMVADFHDKYSYHNGVWRITERLILPVFRRTDLAPTVASSLEGTPA